MIELNKIIEGAATNRSRNHDPFNTSTDKVDYSDDLDNEYYVYADEITIASLESCVTKDFLDENNEEYKNSDLFDAEINTDMIVLAIKTKIDEYPCKYTNDIVETDLYCVSTKKDLISIKKEDTYINLSTAIDSFVMKPNIKYPLIGYIYFCDEDCKIKKIDKIIYDNQFNYQIIGLEDDFEPETAIEESNSTAAYIVSKKNNIKQEEAEQVWKTKEDAINNFITLNNEYPITAYLYTAVADDNEIYTTTSCNKITFNSKDEYCAEGYVNETLETKITRPFLPKQVTLYHGSNNKFDVIEPMTNNIGTRLSDIRKSSFWTLDPDAASLFAIGDMIYTYIDKSTLSVYDLDTTKISIDKDKKDEVEEILKSNSAYLYKVTIDRDIVGRGHNRELNEYTLDRPVKPDEVIELNYTRSKKLIQYVDAEDIKKIQNNLTNLYGYDNSTLIDKIVYHSLKSVRKRRKNLKKSLKEATVEQRENEIKILLKALQNEGIKAEVTARDKNWGSKKWIAGECRSVCIYVGQKDYDKGFKIIKDIIRSQKDFCAHKDNYYTVFVRDKTFKPIKAIKESADKSTLSKDFQKKSGGNFKYIDLHSTEAKKYLAEIKSKYVKEYARDGELVIDVDKDTYAGYIITQEDSKDNNKLWLEPLFIKKQYRGYGLSERLVKDGVSKYHATHIHVLSDNQIAINLYKKCGFKEINKEKYNVGTYIIMSINGKSAVQESKDIKIYDQDIIKAGEYLHNYIRDNNIQLCKRDLEWDDGGMDFAESLNTTTKEYLDQTIELFNKCLRLYTPYKGVVVTKCSKSSKSCILHVGPNYEEGYYTESAVVKEYKESKLHPVFIVTVFTGSTIGKIIQKATHNIYSHAALALDSNLEKLYSYNLHTNNTTGGLSFESISGYIDDSRDATMQVSVVYLKKRDYKTLKDRFKWLEDNYDKTSYNVLNLFKILIGKVDNGKDQLSMVCSQFVDSMFKFINVDLTDKPSSLVTPGDISKINHKKVYKIYEGSVANYDPELVDKQLALLNNKHGIKPIKESSITYSFDIKPIFESKEFPIQFDEEGNLLISKKENIDFLMEYKKTKKLRVNYAKYNNLEGMKYEAAKLWYMNTILIALIENWDGKSYSDKEDWTGTRSKILTEFSLYMNQIQKIDTSFNFSQYYESTPFGSVKIKINRSTIVGVSKIIKQIMM